MTGEVAPAGRRDARAQLGVLGADQDRDGGSATLDRMVTAAFVLSLCGIVIWGCAVVGLILGLVARRSIVDRGAPRRGMVTASIAIGAVPVVLGVLALLAALAYLAFTG